MSTMERKRRRPPLESFQVEEAVRLYGAGWSVRRLARRYGTHFANVARALRRRGVEMRPRGNPIPNFFQVRAKEAEPWVDPIWGRLAYLMYEKRGFSRRHETGELSSGKPIDLGSPPE